MEEKVHKIKKSTEKVLSDTERIIKKKNRAEKRLLKIKQERLEKL